MAGSGLSHEFTVIPPAKETAKDHFSAAVSRTAVRRYEPAALRAAALPCGRARGSVHTSTPYRQNRHRTLRLAAGAQSPDTAVGYIKAPKDAPSETRAAAAPARAGIPLLSKCGKIHPPHSCRLRHIKSARRQPVISASSGRQSLSTQKSQKLRNTGNRRKHAGPFHTANETSARRTPSPP